MADANNFVSGNGARFYEPSGHISVIGILVTIGIGSVVGIAAAFQYSFVDSWFPIIYGNILIAAAFGFVIGYATSYGARLGKLRDPKVVTRIAVHITILSYLASWVFWLWIIACRGNDDLEFARMLANPKSFWQALVWVYDNGTWAVSPHPAMTVIASPNVNGAFLVAVWIGEAITIFVASLVTVRMRASARPFCEPCRAWCGKPALVHTYRGTHTPPKSRCTSKLTIGAIWRPCRLRLQGYVLSGVDR